MKDKITQAIRERVAEVFKHNSWVDWECSCSVCKERQNDALAEILSIRLNEKLEPDPKGRYHLEVVDERGEFPLKHKCDKEWREKLEGANKHASDVVLAAVKQERIKIGTALKSWMDDETAPYRRIAQAEHAIIKLKQGAPLKEAVNEG